MINGKIDLRSDTVTVPTEEMRQAMFTAIVGDDVYGDDATINALEVATAAKFGKEAALFVPTGTMSNQLALFTHCVRGQEVILPDECHILAHEAGAGAIIAGAQFRNCTTNVDGEMDLATVERYIRKDPSDIHQTSTALISYENADSQGRVIALEYMEAVKALAEKYEIPVHLDGARIFNSAAVLGVDVKVMAKCADTISVCLSKGLCAPAGSMLVGSAAFVAAARRKRKVMGGGMRQVGILAAAGQIALDKMSTRLGDDHENAKYFAARLNEVDGVSVFMNRLQINMVFFDASAYALKSPELVAYMAENDVVINGEEDGVFRFVTHNYVSCEEIDKVVDLMRLRA